MPSGTVSTVIGETSPDDANFAVNSNSDGGPARVRLTSSVDPVSSTGHVISTRLQFVNGSGDFTFTVKLKQGAVTVKATRSITVAIANVNFATDVWTLSAGEADSITDYTDLRLEFANPNDGVSIANLSWAQMSLPDAPAGGVPRIGFNGGLTSMSDGLRG